LTLGFFWWVNFRYEVDFLPALMLLAAVGILGLERTLAPTSESGLADRPQVWRWAVRCGWGLLLSFSMAFNLFASIEHHAKIYNNLGIALAQVGRVQEAIIQFEQALRIEPDYAEAHSNLGLALGQTGQLQEAIRQFEQALLIQPDDIGVRCNLAIALAQLGRTQEAMGHWERALRIKPDSAEVHYNLGVALEQMGKLKEAIGHYEQALRLKPDYAEARNSLARLQAAH
jgi:tetratricopeptide (TPR) repeat protein